MKDLAKQLARFPRVQPIHLPTPFEAMPALTRELGAATLYVKRDDLTGLAVGGNKTRKLQFVVGAALEEGADTLITTGGIQSNHARQTAAFAVKTGLRCELVLQHALADPPAEYLRSGNVLLDHLLGAVVHMPPPDLAAGDVVQNLSGEAQMAEVAEAARRAGRKPYIVPLGASTPTGALGYAECAAEILAQPTAKGIAVDWVVLGSGSAGTQAGLLAGFKALGAPTRVMGIAVSGTEQETRRKLVASLAQQCAELLGWSGAIVEDDVVVNGDYVGEGYGLFADEVINVVRQTARLEALLIDPVYTGKAMLGLYDLSRRGFFKRGENVVFLHTGGTPGLFAYTERF